MNESEIETNDYNSEVLERDVPEVQRGDVDEGAQSLSGDSGSGEARDSEEDTEHRDHKAKTILENENKIEIMVTTP